MSDTPRTDALAYFFSQFGWKVDADFARDLERELAAVTAERDAARAALNANALAAIDAAERAQKAEAEKETRS